MKKILKSICFVLFIICSIKLYFNFTVKKINKYYNVSYGKGLEKKFFKLESIKTNKIVIAGGSNVNFSIDSDLMESKLGIPVINMGLHASFQSFTIIETIIPYLKKGDLLIISSEFNSKLYGSSTEVANYFTYMPFKAKLQVYKNIKAINPILKSLVKTSQENILKYNFEKKLLVKSGVYSYDAFKNDNLFEDEISSKMPDKTYNSFGMNTLSPNNDLELLTYLENLKKRLEKLNIDVFFALPAAAKNSFSKQNAIEYYKDLSNKTKIKLLSNRTYFYPQDSLLNSQYHLNNKGRKGRSHNLSIDLSTYLNKSINKIKEKFFIKSALKDSVKDELKINDVLQGKLIKNILQFKRETTLVENTNYYRVKVKGDVFNKKTFKIVIKADSLLVNDIYFKATGALEEWDEKYVSNNNFVLVKKDIKSAFYKNGFSYAGFHLKNLNQHKAKKIEIVSTKIFDSSILKEKKYLELKNDVNYIIHPSKSNVKINQIIEQLKSSKLVLNHNYKYFFLKEKNNLVIKDLYEGKTYNFNIKNNKKLVLNGIDKLIEITELY